MRGFDKIVQKNPHLLEVNTSGWGIQHDIVLYSQIVLCINQPSGKKKGRLYHVISGGTFFPKAMVILKVFSLGMVWSLPAYQLVSGFPWVPSRTSASQRSGDLLHQCLGPQQGGGTQKFSTPGCLLEDLYFFLVDFLSLDVSSFFSPT